MYFWNLNPIHVSHLNFPFCFLSWNVHLIITQWLNKDIFRMTKATIFTQWKYVITYLLRKITTKDVYTCELQHKELLNQWFISVDICHLYLSGQIFLKFCIKNWKKKLPLFSSNSFYLWLAATDCFFACPLSFKIYFSLASNSLF